jgi:hypothetical protein
MFMQSEFVLKLKDEKKKKFFLELISQLDFIDHVKEVKGKKLGQVMDLIDSFNEVELHLKGKKKLKSAKEFLNEI